MSCDDDYEEHAAAVAQADEEARLADLDYEEAVSAAMAEEEG